MKYNRSCSVELFTVSKVNLVTDEEPQCPWHSHIFSFKVSPLNEAHKHANIHLWHADLPKRGFTFVIQWSLARGAPIWSSTEYCSKQVLRLSGNIKFRVDREGYPGHSYQRCSSGSLCRGAVGYEQNPFRTKFNTQVYLLSFYSKQTYYLWSGRKASHKCMVAGLGLGSQQAAAATPYPTHPAHTPLSLYFPPQSGFLVQGSIFWLPTKFHIFLLIVRFSCKYLCVLIE